MWSSCSSSFPGSLAIPNNGNITQTEERVSEVREASIVPFALCRAVGGDFARHDSRVWEQSENTVVDVHIVPASSGTREEIVRRVHLWVWIMMRNWHTRLGLTLHKYSRARRTRWAWRRYFYGISSLSSPVPFGNQVRSEKSGTTYLHSTNVVVLYVHLSMKQGQVARPSILRPNIRHVHLTKSNLKNSLSIGEGNSKSFTKTC